jgi:diguanylate cyclase (GGDEF)-like protein
VKVRQSELATSARLPLLLTVLAVGGAAALTFGLPADAPHRHALVTLVMLGAPATALAASIIAALSVRRNHSIPWQVLCTAAALALLGQVHRYGGAGALDTLHAGTNAAAGGAFVLGVAILLRRHTSGRTLETALDVGIIGTASLLALGRWTSLEDQLVGRLGASLGSTAVATATAAGAAGITAAVLLVARSVANGRLAACVGPPTVALAASGIGIAVWLLATMFDGNLATAADCCALGSAAGLAFVAAWLGVAWAGLRSLDTEPGAPHPVDTIAKGSRLRLLAAPMAALLLGTTALDAAVNGTFGVSLATGTGVLGILLALRLAHLLYATRSHSPDQLQLAQSVTLIEVSRALSGMRQLDETLTLVTRWAVRLLDGRAAVIELLKPEDSTLEVHAVYGLPSEMVGMSFPVEGSFTGWVIRNGRARSTENARLDPLLHAASLPFLGGSPLASVPLRYADQTLGTLSCISSRAFTTADLDLLGAFADQAAVAIENARLFRQVHQLSLTDPLTGLANRRQLERDIAREFLAARRGRRLIAVMFDLNRFKRFNDRFGHLAGDDALRRFGTAIRAITRSMNVAARYGGDEFMVLLTDTDPVGAGIFIQRIQEAFPGADAPEHLRELSVCGGFAEFTLDMVEPEHLIAAADAALYRNKTPSLR